MKTYKLLGDLRSPQYWKQENFKSAIFSMFKTMSAYIFSLFVFYGAYIGLLAFIIHIK